MVLEQLMAANLEKANRITIGENVWVRHDAGSPEHLLSQARDCIADLGTQVDMCEARIAELERELKQVREWRR